MQISAPYLYRASASWAGARVLLLVLAAVACCPEAARAQVRKVGSEFTVNSFTTTGQYQPRVCVLEPDSFLAVWFGANPIRSELYGTRAQRFMRNGSPLASEFLVTSAATTDKNVEQVPNVAKTGDSGFVVVWESYYSSKLSNIGAQRFSSDGSPMGEAIQVNTGGPAERSPTVAADRSGEFAVAWVDGMTEDDYSSVVRVRKFDSDGKPTTDELDVSDVPGFSIDANVAMQAGGDFLVLWTQFGRDRPGGAIFGQKFGSDGSKLGPNFNVDPTTTFGSARPAVDMKQNGDFVVAWQNYGEDGSGYGIFGRQFKADGTPIEPRFQVNSYTADQQTVPSVSFDGSGGFVVVWESYVSVFSTKGQDGSGRGIFGQRFKADSQRQGREFQVNSYTQGDQGYRKLRESDVTSWGNGDFVAVWSTPEKSGFSYDISGQRFHVDADLGPLCGDAGVADLRVTSRDALAILRGAVHLFDCEPCLCDVDSQPGITANDALAALRVSIGTLDKLSCPPCIASSSAERSSTQQRGVPSSAD